MEIEQLDFGTTKVRNASVKVVSAQDCYHPKSYGREIIVPHVHQIAATFDYKKLGEITIAEIPTEDGLYEINDGNHRHQAMIRRFGRDVSFTATLLPAGLTVEDRAREFTIRNKRRAPMRPVDMFRAGVVMQDPVALEIKRICEETGVGIINYNTKTHAYPNIASLRDLDVLCKSGNLEQVIHIIRSAYDGVPMAYSKKAMTAHLLRAVNKLLQHFGNDSKFKEARLIDTLKRYDAQYWVGVIMQAAQTSKEGVSALLNEYNYKLTHAFRLKDHRIFH